MGGCVDRQKYSFRGERYKTTKRQWRSYTVFEDPCLQKNITQSFEERMRRLLQVNFFFS